MDTGETQLVANSSISQIRGIPFSISSFSHPFVLTGTRVIETGATHQVCCHPSLFFDSIYVQNTTITLPNGQSVGIERIGSIKLSDFLY